MLGRRRLISFDEDLSVLKLALEVRNVGHELSQADIVVYSIVWIVWMLVVGARVLVGLILKVLEWVGTLSNLESTLPLLLIL